MPKVVDHAQRRRLITEALWRIAARHGLEAASLTEVAAEAGVSKGMVQHYFRSREEMLLFAIDQANKRLRDRVQQRVAADTDPTPMAMLRALTLALLPTDDQSRTGALVSVAFFIRELSDAGLANTFRQGFAELLALVDGQIRAAQQSGQIDHALDPEQEAQILLALAGGLTSNILSGHTAPSAAITTVEYHLARLTHSPRTQSRHRDNPYRARDREQALTPDSTLSSAVDCAGLTRARQVAGGQ